MYGNTSPKISRKRNTARAKAAHKRRIVGLCARTMVLAALIICLTQAFIYGKAAYLSQHGQEIMVQAAQITHSAEAPPEELPTDSGNIPEKPLPESGQGPENPDNTQDSVIHMTESAAGPGTDASAATPETVLTDASPADVPSSAAGSDNVQTNANPESDPNWVETTAAVPETVPVPSWIDPSRPMIAFTFDDGPYTKIDNRIIDVLEAYGGHATFFIVGSRVNDYTDTLRRLSDSGSEIANHSFNHKNLEKLPPDEVIAQIEQTNDVVEAVTGTRPNLVRVPYGAYKGQVCELVNYPIIQWNVDTLDWKTKDKAAVLNEILTHAKDGNIVLMHDLYESTAAAFEEAIPQLVEQGFQLVTVSELYAAKGIPMEPGKVYFNIKAAQ